MCFAGRGSCGVAAIGASSPLGAKAAVGTDFAEKHRRAVVVVVARYDNPGLSGAMISFVRMACCRDLPAEVERHLLCSCPTVDRRGSRDFVIEDWPSA